MSKKTIVWLAVATALVFIGAIIFVSVMMGLDWDFTMLSTAQYETNEYIIDDNYRHITIATDTANVAFVPSDTATTTVVCYERKHVAHTVTVTEDMLRIETVDTRRWYEHIGIFFDTTSVTVYMPRGEYVVLSVDTDTGDVAIPKEFAFESVDVDVDTGDVTNAASASAGMAIRTDTGDIAVRTVSAGSITLSTATGRVTAADVDCAGDIRLDASTGKTLLTDVTCHNLLSDGDTGDLVLQNVVAEGRFSIERDTGDVQFEGCDAADIRVETDTGSVKGSLLTDKVFITDTDTGRVDVPKTISGGRCEIETDTGNIVITISGHALV